MSDTDRGVFDVLDRRTVGKAALGFVLAFVVLYLLAVGIGIEEIRRELADASLRWLAVACLSTAIGLVAWARAWQVVLRVVGVSVSFRKLVVTYYAATFANYVTPFGQAGGEPFIAYVLSRDTDASYEDSLASVVTADLLNLLPFFTFAVIGVAVLVVRTTLPEQVRGVAAALVAFAVGVPAMVVAGWRFRLSVGRFVLRVATPVVERVPRITIGGLRRRMRELDEAFGRIAADPRALVHALVFSYVGWLFFALPLYFAVLTVGDSISLLLILFIVPASTLAGLTPSPGGLGGVTAALVALLGVLAGFSTAAGYAVATVYRLASYWFAVLVGGIAAVWVVARS